MKNSNVATHRIRLLSLGVFLFALILVFKLYTIQVVNGAQWSERANRQYARSDSALFDRGHIYFTAKDGIKVSAGTLKSGYLLAINPQKITDVDALYNSLKPFITLSYDEFLAKASRTESRYVEVATELPQSIVDSLEKIDDSSLIIVKDRWRFYPGGTLAAHALGFLAFKDDEYGGRYGLERQYEDVLERNQGESYVNFFAEIFSNIKETVAHGGLVEGDIVTTIEPTVQATLESTLKSINEEWGARLTGGVIMDPVTGAIYAMGTYPAFDPNNFKTEEDLSRFTNVLVENVFEMGSIIKPLTVAAGLDAGAVTANTLYDDTGCLSLNKSRICNYDGKARGVVSMQEVLNQSLNTGVTFVMEQMGKDKFASYMKDFGLGVETGIDLPNETHGLINNLDSPREIEYATASFGQGIALTPIATVRALAALGNGGILPTPHLVEKIEYRVGGSKTLSYPPGKQVISPQTSEEISRMLTKVVDEALLNGEVKLDDYSVAAKTGTAQIAKDGGGGYYDDRYLHSFFGYFPSYKPRFIVFLFTVEPEGVRYASETLTRPFADLTKFLIGYYEVPPDRGESVLVE